MQSSVQIEMRPFLSKSAREDEWRAIIDALADSGVCVNNFSPPSCTRSRQQSVLLEKQYIKTIMRSMRDIMYSMPYGDDEENGRIYALLDGDVNDDARGNADSDFCNFHVSSAVSSSVTTPLYKSSSTSSSPTVRRPFVPPDNLKV